MQYYPPSLYYVLKSGNFSSPTYKGFFFYNSLAFSRRFTFVYLKQCNPNQFFQLCLIFILIHKHGLSHAFRSPLTSHG